MGQCRICSEKTNRIYGSEGCYCKYQKYPNQKSWDVLIMSFNSKEVKKWGIKVGE